MKIVEPKNVWLSVASGRECVLVLASEAATMAGMNQAALEKLSAAGVAPPIVIYQGKRYFHKEDLAAFIDRRSPKENLLMSTSDAARLIGVHRRTLESWSKDGIAPNPVRINGQLRYVRTEIVNWVVNRCPSQKKGGK